MTPSIGLTWVWAPLAELREIRRGERTSSLTASAAWRASLSTGSLVSLKHRHFCHFQMHSELYYNTNHYCLVPVCAVGNIYWTDQGFDVIEVARLNGSFRYVVISQGLDKPRAITVHPEKGWDLSNTDFLSFILHFCSMNEAALSSWGVVCAGICFGQSGDSIHA